uniref:Uncharacterized protein n=1 Tax=Knipowitschia caucasica TaxID=637954 RepID=A0AAV2KXR6_KNICA
MEMRWRGMVVLKVGLQFPSGAIPQLITQRQTERQAPLIPLEDGVAESLKHNTSDYGYFSINLFTKCSNDDNNKHVSFSFSDRRHNQADCVNRNYSDSSKYANDVFSIFDFPQLANVSFSFSNHSQNRANYRQYFTIQPNVFAHINHNSFSFSNFVYNRFSIYHSDDSNYE